MFSAHWWGKCSTKLSEYFFKKWIIVQRLLFIWWITEKSAKLFFIRFCYFLPLGEETLFITCIILFWDDRLFQPLHLLQYHKLDLLLLCNIALAMQFRRSNSSKYNLLLIEQMTKSFVNAKAKFLTQSFAVGWYNHFLRELLLQSHQSWEKEAHVHIFVSLEDVQCLSNRFHHSTEVSNKGNFRSRASSQVCSCQEVVHFLLTDIYHPEDSFHAVKHRIPMSCVWGITLRPCSLQTLVLDMPGVSGSWGDPQEWWAQWWAHGGGATVTVAPPQIIDQLSLREKAPNPASPARLPLCAAASKWAVATRGCCTRSGVQDSPPTVWGAHCAPEAVYVAAEMTYGKSCIAYTSDSTLWARWASGCITLDLTVEKNESLTSQPPRSFCQSCQSCRSCTVIVRYLFEDAACFTSRGPRTCASALKKSSLFLFQLPA